MHNRYGNLYNIFSGWKIMACASYQTSLTLCVGRSLWLKCVRATGSIFGLSGFRPGIVATPGKCNVLWLVKGTMVSQSQKCGIWKDRDTQILCDILNYYPLDSFSKDTNFLERDKF